jgi:hypothetical protein
MWTVVRSGITRTVILTHRYAIKVPSLRRHGDGFAGLLWSISRGILANQSETQWWRNSPAENRGTLCPVLHSWLGGIINIYPRCALYRCTPEQELMMFAREWSPIIEAEFPAPGDNKPDNFGWHDGRLVRIDYDMNYNGCPHDRSGFVNRAREEAAV